MLVEPLFRFKKSPGTVWVATPFSISKSMAKTAKAAQLPNIKVGIDIVNKSIVEGGHLGEHIALFQLFYHVHNGPLLAAARGHVAAALPLPHIGEEVIAVQMLNPQLVLGAAVVVGLIKGTVDVFRLHIDVGAADALHHSIKAVHIHSHIVIDGNAPRQLLDGSHGGLEPGSP